MTDQPLETFRFAIVCAMAILIGLVAQSIGLLIGAACSVTVSHWTENHVTKWPQVESMT